MNRFLGLIPVFLSSYVSGLNLTLKGKALVELIIKKEKEGILYDLSVVSLLIEFILSYRNSIRSELIKHIDYRLKKFRSIGILGSLTGEDIFQIVMEKMLTGARHWNYRIQDFSQYVFSSANSVIYNYKKISLKNPDEVIYTSKRNGDSHNVLRDVEAQGCDLQKEIESREKINFFLGCLTPELLNSCYARIDEKSDKEVAGEFKIPVSEVKNLRKRLRRFTPKYFPEGTSYFKKSIRKPNKK